MKYQIAIVEDMAVDTEYLHKLVENWSKKRGLDTCIQAFVSAESFLFHYCEKNDVDILLLDIEMGAMDGVSLAKHIRQDNESMQIIFVTGYGDYIAEGYDVSALHYLMKPVKEEKLMTVLDRAVSKLAKNEKVLHLESNGEMVRIPIYQIRYAEVSRNYVTIYAAQEITIKMTLAELAKALDERFYRVGRSAIVNLTKISRVTKEEIKLVDGSCIPLPRKAYEGINRAIINME